MLGSTSPRPSSGRAVDRSPTVDVRLPHLPAVASVSLTLFYHSGRLPRSELRLFRCATSPATSLLSLTVISPSRRRLRIPPPRHTPLCRCGSCICRSWGGLGFGGPGGMVVGVCPFYVVYLVYLECLPLLLSVPAARHCDRCFCHSRHAVRSACMSAFIRLERLLHLPLRPCHSHAACSPCCLLIGALFVLSRLVRTGRSRHGRAPYASHRTIFFADDCLSLQAILDIVGHHFRRVILHRIFKLRNKRVDVPEVLTVIVVDNPARSIRRGHIRPKVANVGGLPVSPTVVVPVVMSRV
jgi:hypothetical protein